jgi:hypothetical protein
VLKVSVTIGLASVLGFVGATRGVAGEPEYAPLPERLVTAKAVYLVNDSGDLKAYDRFYSELKKWNQFTVVRARTDADIVMALTSNSQYALTIASGTATSGGGMTTGSATAVTVPSTSLHLRVFDANTAEVLWTDMTEKWVTSGHAPTKLVSNLKKRFPKATRN